jgi:nucleotide-binding universal stress UspA family protein
MPTLFRRILVPHDFSTHADRALAVAAALAAEHRGRLLVLHAVAPMMPIAPLPTGGPAPWIPPTNLVPDTRRELEKRVTRKLRRRNRMLRPRCQVVMGDPVDRILAAARSADSIVMATSGRTGLSRLLIGSVAERVVRHAPVPVLALRPAAMRMKTHARRKKRR